MEAVLDDPYILIHERKISNMKDLLPILEQSGAHGQALSDFGGRRGRRSLSDPGGEQTARLTCPQCAAVKAPGFGDRRKAMLQDIAILTNGQVISDDLGIKLENITLNDLSKPNASRLTKTPPRSWKARARPTRFRGASNRSRPRLRTRRQTMIARNCRNA